MGLGDRGVHLHARIQYRSPEYPELIETPANGVAATWHTTTPGRVFFNAALPGHEIEPDRGRWPRANMIMFVNQQVGKKELGTIVDDLARGYPKKVVAESLDAMKDVCFDFATRSGLTVSIDDVKTPPEKAAILDAHEKRRREGRGPVPEGHHHRRRASADGGRDLELGDRRGDRQDG